MAIVSLGVGLCVLEAGVRAFVRPGRTAYTGRGLYRADDDLGHALRPEHVSGDVRTNSWGFRDREYTVDKPKGAYRIVGAGDSFTFGSAYPREVYLEVLEDRLRGAGRPFPVEVINTGVPCYSTHQELGHLRKFGLRFDPDLVILGLFPTGDVGENHSDEHLDVIDGELAATAVEPWERRLRRWHLYRFVRGRLTAFAAAPPPSPGEKAYLDVEVGRLDVCRPALRKHLKHGYEVTERLLLELRDELRSRGVALVVLLIPDEAQVDGALFEKLLPLTGRPAKEYDLDYPNRRLGEFMKAHGIEAVDPLPALRDAARVAPVYLRQDTHWNEAGHAIAAEALERALAPRLEAHTRAYSGSQEAR